MCVICVRICICFLSRLPPQRAWYWTCWCADLWGRQLRPVRTSSASVMQDCITDWGREAALPHVSRIQSVGIANCEVLWILVEIGCCLQVCKSSTVSTGCGHPVPPVRAGIIVQQEFLKMSSTVSPIHTQVKDQETSLGVREAKVWKPKRSVQRK